MEMEQTPMIKEDYSIDANESDSQDGHGKESFLGANPLVNQSMSRN
jgi:hypothetical protein